MSPAMFDELKIDELGVDELKVAELLRRVGRNSTIQNIRPLKQGGNNRSWQIVTSDDCYALKQYFRHAGDQRNRLKAEFDFAVYASAVDPDLVPQPIIQDDAAGVAIYTFIAGEPLRAEQIGAVEVEAAAHFFSALNASECLRAANELPTASEACFSIEAHLNLIGQRIEALSAALQGADDITARDFVRALEQRWYAMKNEVRDSATRNGLSLAEELPIAQRCVSPSDFGFHNALRDAAGKLRFLDFEYAGWDDPAKMVGDFFAQLSVPVPGKFFDEFARLTLGAFSDFESLLLRAKLLRAVYQVKWCCIALNIFLPVHLARRRFANPGLDAAALKNAQLAKAQSIYHALVSIPHGLH